MPSASWYAWMFACGLVNVAMPIAVGVVLWRRLRFSPLAPAIGAAAFLISQVLLRLPAIGLLQPRLAPRLAGSPALQWAWLVFLSVTAGLFEESARWIAFRWALKKSPRTLATGVGYGVGHGGIEALLLIGVGQLASAGMIWLYGTGLLDKLIPVEALKAFPAQLAAIASQPAWTPLLAVWERAGSLCFHIALSVLVLIAVARRRISLLLLAIAFHAAGNLSAVGWMVWQKGQVGSIGAEVIVSLFALAGVAFLLNAHRWLDSVPPLTSR
jgi:uncharacterized membrane protein YhfC